MLQVRDRTMGAELFVIMPHVFGEYLLESFMFMIFIWHLCSYILYLHPSRV